MADAPKDRRTFPLLGQLPHFLSDPLGFLEQAALAHERQGLSGPIRLPLGRRPTFLIASPSGVAELLGGQSRFFQTPNRRFAWPQLLNRSSTSTISPEESDDDHTAREALEIVRRLNTVMSGPWLIAAGDITMEHAQRTSLIWRSGQTRDVAREFHTLALEIQARLWFDAAIDNHRSTLFQNLAALADLVTLPIPAWSWKQPFRLLARLRADRAINRALDDLRPAPDASTRNSAVPPRELPINQIPTPPRISLWDAVVNARESHADPDSLDTIDPQWRTIAKTVAVRNFLLSQQRLYALLSWSWWILANDNEIRLSAIWERDQVVGKRPPRMIDCPRLTLLEGVVKEVARMFPPDWLLIRQARIACVLEGRPIPIGAWVLASPCLTQRNPEAYADPQGFLPERWEHQAITPIEGSWFPFGAEPDTSPAVTLLIRQTVLLLAHLMGQYHFVCNPGWRRAQPHPGFVLQPRDGLQATLESRPTLQSGPHFLRELVANTRR